MAIEVSLLIRHHWTCRITHMDKASPQSSNEKMRQNPQSEPQRRTSLASKGSDLDRVPQPALGAFEEQGLPGL